MKCGSIEDLHTHHIKPKATHPELTFDLSNGITLCYRCHRKEHETSRPIRIRSDNPHKNTYKQQIRQLLSKIADQEDLIDRLKKKLPENQCNHDGLPEKKGRCSHTKYCKWQQ